MHCAAAVLGEAGRSRVSGVDISFRPLAITDLENIVQWMLDDCVRRWWYPHQETEEEIRAEWEPRVRGEPNDEDKTDRYVVSVDAIDIGIIQTSDFADYPDHAAEMQIADAAGVDVLIGLPEWRNRGVGTALIRKFVNEVIFANPAIQRCTIDPHPENRPALRACEKVGFRHVRTFRSMVENVDIYLMVMDRPVT